MALTCGLYQEINKVSSPGNFNKKVPAADLADGQFHAIEIGSFVADATLHPRFYIALKNAADPKVLLDCIWLQEVK